MCVRLIRQFFQWVVVFEHTIDIVWGGRPSRRDLEDRGDGRPQDVDIICGKRRARTEIPVKASREQCARWRWMARTVQAETRCMFCSSERFERLTWIRARALVTNYLGRLQPEEAQQEALRIIEIHGGATMRARYAGRLLVAVTSGSSGFRSPRPSRVGSRERLGACRLRAELASQKPPSQGANVRDRRLSQPERGGTAVSQLRKARIRLPRVRVQPNLRRSELGKT